MIQGYRRAMARVPLLAAGLVLGAVATGAAQQGGGVGGESFLTQAGSAARAPAPIASTDPASPLGESLREGLFRHPPPARAGTASPDAGFAPTGGGGNAAHVEQQGERHYASIDQQGSGNTARIEQHGTANTAAIVQRGAGNHTAVLQQGTGHVFAARVAGTANALNFAQRGADNHYILDFAGSGLQPDHTVVQAGTGLRAVQVGTGSLPFGIEQRGRGMAIRIEHNGAGP